MGDAHKLEVAQFPESGVRPDHPSFFLVRKNGAKGELDCKVCINKESSYKNRSKIRSNFYPKCYKFLDYINKWCRR